MQCPKCGNDLKEGSRFCKYCGNPVPQVTENEFSKQMTNELNDLSEKRCSKCGKPIKEGNAFCIHCGTAVSNQSDVKQPNIKQSDVKQSEAKTVQEKEEKSGKGKNRKKHLKIHSLLLANLRN